MLKTIKENHIHTIKNNTYITIYKRKSHTHNKTYNTNMTNKKKIYLKKILIYLDRNQRGTPDHQQSQDVHQPRSADNRQLNR